MKEIVAEGGLRKMEKKIVIYGTSDHYLNYGEILLTAFVAEKEKAQAQFFHYPKGPEWMIYESSLFEPYKEFPTLPESLRIGSVTVQIIPIQKAAEQLGCISMGEAAEVIRQYREIKSFIAVNLPGKKPVYVSSKDKRWKREWKNCLLKEVLHNPSVKVGGAFLYFVYGFFLAQHPEYIGILPNKLKDDVFGAFTAGQVIAGRKARIISTGEIDFMTAKQWQLWKQDRKWRKAPFWAFERLLNDPVLQEVRSRLLEGRYCPLVYDEERDFFFFLE